jgi:phosphatidylinositol-binding clathrin assembly protein
MIEADLQRNHKGKHGMNPSPGGISRSKTMMGRKLRSMTVEKGLLRETKAVHRMIDSLVECRVSDLISPTKISLLRIYFSQTVLPGRP